MGEAMIVIDKTSELPVCAQPERQIELEIRRGLCLPVCCSEALLLCAPLYNLSGKRFETKESAAS